VVDLACRTDVDCGGNYLPDLPNTDEKLKSNLSKLVTANVRRSGAVADGITKLLIKMRSDVGVSFSIKDKNGRLVPPDEWGTLLYRTKNESDLWS